MARPIKEGQPNISGGYILLSRKIIESEIWKKPPLYIKIWVFLLSKAQHSDYKKLKRGQLITSIPEIIEECSWYIGYRKESPTKDQVYQVIDWLRDPNGRNSRNCYEGNYEADTKATMITTTKATHGMVVTIDNYSFYQDSKNYESNDEGNNEKDTKATGGQRQPNNINKNDKNDKNKNIYTAETEILNFWISKGLQKHSPTDSMLEQIKTAIKKFGGKEIIIKAIENYSKIYFDNTYFYNHIWKLDRFLKQKNGLPEFLEDGQVWLNYMNKKQDNSGIDTGDKERIS